MTADSEQLPGNLKASSLAFLFVAVTSIYFLTARTELTSIDEIFILRTGESIADRGSAEIEETGGRTWSRFSLIPSLWIAPFAWVAEKSLPDLPDRDAWRLYFTRLGNCSALALSCVLLAAWLARLGHSMRIAMGTALFYAFGTMAFPYAATFYVQIVSVPLLVAAVWSVAAGGTWSSIFWIALLVTCRSDQALLLPAFWLAIRSDARPGSWRRVLGVTAGAVSGIGLSALTFWSRGDPLFNGPYAGETFTTSLVIGLPSLLLSFGKGLAWYSPLSFVGLGGSFAEAERRPHPGRLILYVLGTELLVVAHWWTWHGGMSWGPRLLLPILPLCMFPIAHWLSSWSEIRPLFQRLFLLVVLASVVINLWAVLQPIEKDSSGVYSETEAIYTPSGTPLLGPRLPSPVWLINAPSSPLKWGTIAALSLLAIGGLAGCLNAVRPSLSASRRSVHYCLGAAFCGVLAQLPLWVQTGEDLWHSRFGNEGQYRAMLSTASGYEGTLLVPITGIYIFHDDNLQPLDVQLGKGRVFEKSRIAVVELTRGRVPIKITGRGTLRWTIPGYGSYKSAIPVDYLASPTPTLWQRFQVLWRHFGWVLWIPAFFLLCLWLLQENGHVRKDTGPVQSSLGKQPPPGPAE